MIIRPRILAEMLVVATALAGHLPSCLATFGDEIVLTVDRAAPGPAISPYIYGQFIEHLGRCIRDGIWAEKLRDRKFLLELGKSWQAVKGPGADAEIRVDPGKADRGRHMAILIRDAKASPCGIRQDGIGLLEGKEYVGYAILSHAAAPTPVELRLSWGSGPGAGQSVIFSQVTTKPANYGFRFRAGQTTDQATLAVTMASPGSLRIGCLSLMPADNVQGMRADTLELVRKLNAPIVRWPGGNFVSGYHWKDGIGPRDARPPRWERAWNDVEDNDFGIDEFMVFCRLVKTEPLVVVNTGLGSVQEAVEEVEYANGSAKTRGGAQRAKNGHPEPYRVVWWGIGNEMYGGWQLGNVPIERYTARHNEFVQAMKAADPRIKTIGVGAPGKWNDAFVPACAAHMDLLSLHHYSERKFRVPFSPEDAKKYEEKFLGYSDCVAAGVRGLVADLRKRQKEGNADVRRLRLAIDEWGLVRDWNPAPDAPGVGSFEHYYPLGDAITIGRALHGLLRAADLVAMANWPQTVNVIGAIKTTRNHAAMDPVGHLLALYRARFGGRLAPATLSAKTTVDAVAAWDPQSGVLAVGLINYSPRSEVAMRLRVQGAGKQPAATIWRIDGPDLGAINVPGQPEKVTTARLPRRADLNQPLILPAHSISVLEMKNGSFQ